MEGIKIIFKIAWVRDGEDSELRQKQDKFKNFSFDILRLKCQEGIQLCWFILLRSSGDVLVWFGLVYIIPNLRKTSRREKWT